MSALNIQSAPCYYKAAAQTEGVKVQCILCIFRAHSGYANYISTRVNVPRNMLVKNSCHSMPVDLHDLSFNCCRAHILDSISQLNSSHLWFVSAITMTECSCCWWTWALGHSWGLAAPPVMKGRPCWKLKQNSRELKVLPQILCGACLGWWIPHAAIQLCSPVLVISLLTALGPSDFLLNILSAVFLPC